MERTQERWKHIAEYWLQNRGKVLDQNFAEIVEGSTSFWFLEGKGLKKDEIYTTLYEIFQLGFHAGDAEKTEALLSPYELTEYREAWSEVFVEKYLPLFEE